MGRIRDSERTRKRILDAGAKVFAAKGFAGASVSDIARRARVSKQLVHHHFRSKEGLFEAVHDVKFRPIDERRETVSEDAASLFAERFRKRAKDLEAIRFLTWEAASGRAVPLRDARQQRIADYGSALRLMQTEGKLPDGFDPKLLQLAILSLATYPMAFGQITRLVTGRAPTDPVFQREWYAFLKALGAALFGGKTARPVHRRKSSRVRRAA